MTNAKTLILPQPFSNYENLALQIISSSRCECITDWFRDVSLSF